MSNSKSSTSGFSSADSWDVSTQASGSPRFGHKESCSIYSASSTSSSSSSSTSSDQLQVNESLYLTTKHRPTLEGKKWKQTHPKMSQFSALTLRKSLTATTLRPVPGCPCCAGTCMDGLQSQVTQRRNQKHRQGQSSRQKSTIYRHLDAPRGSAPLPPHSKSISNCLGSHLSASALARHPASQLHNNSKRPTAASFALNTRLGPQFRVRGPVPVPPPVVPMGFVCNKEINESLALIEAPPKKATSQEPPKGEPEIESPAPHQPGGTCSGAPKSLREKTGKLLGKLKANLSFSNLASADKAKPIEQIYDTPEFNAATTKAATRLGSSIRPAIPPPPPPPPPLPKAADLRPTPRCAPRVGPARDCVLGGGEQTGGRRLNEDSPNQVASSSNSISSHRANLKPSSSSHEAAPKSAQKEDFFKPSHAEGPKTAQQHSKPIKTVKWAQQEQVLCEIKTLHRAKSSKWTFDCSSEGRPGDSDENTFDAELWHVNNKTRQKHDRMGSTQSNSGAETAGANQPSGINNRPDTKTTDNKVKRDPTLTVRQMMRADQRASAGRSSLGALKEPAKAMIARKMAPTKNKSDQLKLVASKSALLLSPTTPSSIVETTAMAAKQDKDSPPTTKRDETLERRRESLKNGDVFIYPSQYKDLNLCRSCSRDKNICRCSLGEHLFDGAGAGAGAGSKRPLFECSSHKSTCSEEGSSDDCSSSSPSSTSATASASSASSSESSSSTSSESSPVVDLEFANEAAGLGNGLGRPQTDKCAHQPTDGCIQLLAPDDPSLGANSSPVKPSLLDQSSKNIAPQTTTTTTTSTIQPATAACITKTVYKISIATASIDQKNNQLRLSTPKIILPESAADLDDKTRLEVGRSPTMKAIAARCHQPAEDASNLLLHLTPSEADLPEQAANLTAISIGNAIVNPINLEQILPLAVSAVSDAAAGVIQSSELTGKTIIDINNNAGSQGQSSPGQAAASEEDHLTCNLNVGDSIKIARASIRIGELDTATGQQSSDRSHTTIVPIKTRRRRDLIASSTKLPWQPAIHENDDADEDDRLQLDDDQVPDVMMNKMNPSACDPTKPSCAKQTTGETTTKTTTTGNLMVQSSEICQVESPKKSIFDGASKDEILEYLEDARERVPDILMAADDVMLISANELIVVNQLEPGSPATPISIVEATEVIQKRQEKPKAQVQQLKEHLEQLYRSSSLKLKGSAPECEGAKRPNESDTTSETTVLLASSASFEGPQVGGGGSSRGSTATPSELQQTPLQRGQTGAPGEMIHRRSLAATNSSMSNTSNTSGASETSCMGEGAPNGLISPSFLSSSTSGLFEAGRRRRQRRNSSAEDADQTERSHALRMIMLQQRYSNRDSLSSPGSTGSSQSASPSSSESSSNQTSGNASANSMFYTSSSLSCSSPLIGQLQLASAGGPSTAAIAAKTPPSSAELVRPAQQLRLHRDDSGVGSEPSPSALGSSATGKDDICAKLDVIREILPTDRALSSSNVRLDATTSSSVNKANFFNPIRAGGGGGAGWNGSHHSATLNKLNSYYMNRLCQSPEFQCLDCDQFIDVHQTGLHLTGAGAKFGGPGELHERMLRQLVAGDSDDLSTWGAGQLSSASASDRCLTPDQLDRAYIAAMNGLPLCKSCEKKRIERKEIISEFVETELKYGRDLKIIHDEFYRPMQIAGLLNKDQINGVFLNLDELIMAHCRFADRLTSALREAHEMGDSDLSTVNIGRLFVESAEMLHTFESYCVRQGSAACLLARLAKERELLRIFLRVSQMENTLLRRMNLAAFLMVPVQRVMKYPLLLSRLYKVESDPSVREALRDAQLKVELHLEHINQQTKGVGATNKIWKKISILSAPISNSRRGILNAEDIGYIKLRKTAMDLLKWDRDETQFIHSGKLNFAPLNEFLVRQKMKPLRYASVHALLIVLGKPNWKYRPDLVKSTLDSKLATPTPGGTGIRETALLLFREKNGRFLLSREPLFLSNCVLSTDCSQFNVECPTAAPKNAMTSSSTCSSMSSAGSHLAKKGPNEPQSTTTTTTAHRERNASVGFIIDTHHRTGSTESTTSQSTLDLDMHRNSEPNEPYKAAELINGAFMSMSSSINSLPEQQHLASSSHHAGARSHSLALPNVATTTTTPSGAAATPTTTTASKATPTCSSSSNLTLLNQLMTKVNGYHKQAQPQQQLSSNGAINQSANRQVNNPTPGEVTSMGSYQAAQSTAPLATGKLATDLNNNSNINSNNCNKAHLNYNHHYFHNLSIVNHEEFFEIHERLTKESLLLRADTPLKTRFWLNLLRYHSKDLGTWRQRRNGLANIMMVRQD